MRIHLDNYSFIPSLWASVFLPANGKTWVQWSLRSHSLLSKTHASVGLHGSMKVVLVSRKTAHKRWGAESITWLPCPGIACSSFGALWGSDRILLFSLSVPGTCVFLPWEWIIELGSWISSKPQTKTRHSLSLNFIFPVLFLVSSYVIAPFGLWVCLRGERRGWAGKGWMLTSNICWLSCRRWRKLF